MHAHFLSDTCSHVLPADRKDRKMWRTLIAMGVIALCNSSSVATERNDSPRKQYAAVTRLRVAAAPENVCTGACEITADGERAKLGPPPAWPLYRASPTQA